MVLPARGVVWHSMVQRRPGQDQVPVEVDVIQECSRESSHSGKRPPVVDVKGHVVGLSWSPQPIAQITLDHPWHPGRGNPEERRTGEKQEER